MDERIYKRDDGVERVWQYSIMPLLEDLFFGQADLEQRYGLARLLQAIGGAGPGGSRCRAGFAGSRRRRRAVMRIQLAEVGSDVEQRLTPEQGRRLARFDVVRAVPSPYNPRAWLIGPAGKVGAARVGDVEDHMQLKVAIQRRSS